MENEVRWERGSVGVRKKAHKLLAKRLSHIMVLIVYKLRKVASFGTVLV
jgi:hypothetical protein